MSLAPARYSEAAKLTPKEAALVDALALSAERGVELSQQELGELAGYGTGETARVSAARALARTHVQDAIRERMRAMAIAEAPNAMAMLRKLRGSGRESARLAAALKLVDLAGIGPQEAQGGGNIAVAVVLPEALGTLLTQARAIPSHALVDQAVAARDHRLLEAGVEPATPPRGPRKAKAKRRGRGRKRAPGSQARGRHTISPPPEPVSGGETDGV